MTLKDSYQTIIFFNQQQNLISRNCWTAARKCSVSPKVLPKVLELAYYAAYFQICDFTFQNIYDNNFNYTTFILETWIHILRDILLNNVTKKYAELSVGDYGMLIQRCNNDVMLYLQWDKDAQQ